MKKVLSIALVLLVVLQVAAMSAFAYSSPGGTEYNKVVVNHTNTGENVSNTEVVVVGDQVQVTALESEKGYTFDGFKIYVKDENGDLVPAKMDEDYEITEVKMVDGTVGKEGVDYELKDGEVVSLEKELLSIKVRPLTSDLYISENYRGVNIKFHTEAGVLSPKTGYGFNGIAIVALLTAIAGACALATRKYAKN